MYVGRIVAIGRTKAGKVAALYRVSSRSFPNRTASMKETAAAIIPKAGFESDIHKNPYIAYNCARIAGAYAIATNGSQTDPITEKVASGMNPRDALTLSLIALDYEKDDYNTPRIAAVVQREVGKGWLGVVRANGIHIREFDLKPAEVFFVSTYETNDISEAQRGEFDAADAHSAARFMIDGGIFAAMTNPVTGVAVMESGDGWQFGMNEPA